MAQGIEIICETREAMILVMSSGDRDYMPLVRGAHRKGWAVEMCAFTTALNAAAEMAYEVDRIRPLDHDPNADCHHDFMWP